ncbi:MAG: hypothetical protein IT376_11815 [Polyangiaceae bacterium]|nr:hypothetical protein [Polyangiaceae bacterium]
MSDEGARALAAALERATAVSAAAGEPRAAIARALVDLAATLAVSRGLPWRRCADGRMGELAGTTSPAPFFEAREPLPPELLGAALERTWDGSEAPPSRAVGRAGRRDAGAHFTPPAWAHALAEAALAPAFARARLAGATRRPGLLAALRVVDPACGAGALLAAVVRVVTRELVGAGVDAVDARRLAARECVLGVDADELSIAAAELALWLEAGGAAPSPRDAGARLRHGEALLGAPGRRGAADAPAAPGLGAAPPVDWGELLAGRPSFDAVVGNPPWVVFAGRAARPLDPGTRAALARRYRAFRRYPTLHAAFVERAAAIAPAGTLALLLPSSVSDLDGYAPMREALTATHAPREPLLELGDGAFRGVVQPSFLLVADPSPGSRPTPRPFRLLERSRPTCEAAEVAMPASLARLAERPPLPAALFGELGFRSTAASRPLLARGSAPGVPPADGVPRRPLLEGKDVGELRVGPPRVFLDEDPARLAAAGARLAPPEHFHRARFVVRQTAAHPIAALVAGASFRNSLLAGFDHPEWPPEVVVGLLNSGLYRALHRLRRRDGRQAAFPQVKLGHLRALPAPPRDLARLTRVAEIVRAASTRGGLESGTRRALDELVLDLFDIAPAEREAIRVAGAGAR